MKSPPLPDWRSLRFLQLFVLLVLLLLLAQGVFAVVMQAVFLNGLLVCLSAAGYGTRLRGALFAVWLLGLLFELGKVTIPGPELADGLAVGAGAAAVLLLTGCVAATLGYVLGSRQVTLDSLFGAVVAYFFVALAFARLYVVVATLQPDSFAIPQTLRPEDKAELALQMLYFSFVTIATLGYGDITPRSPPAQMLAVLEAIAGQFYIAVVIAWLVSVRVTQGAEK